MGGGDGDDRGGGSSGSGSGGEVTALHDLIAGGVAGSASVVVGHPFDTIKVRMQTSGTPGAGGAAGGGGNASSSPLATMRSLFRGMAAPLSTAAMVNAIIFASYGSFSRLWEERLEGGGGRGGAGGTVGSADRAELVHGAVTGEGCVFIERGEHGTHEQVAHRRRMTERRHVDADPSPSEADSGHTGAGEQIAMWRGTAPRESSHVESDFDSRPRRRSEDDNTSLEPPPPREGSAAAAPAGGNSALKVFACGAAAGTVQAFVICPMEHIKCRLQVQTESAAAASSSASTAAATRQSYKGPLDACASILRRHGLTGLYRGMGVTLWRETPAFGLYFATYDGIKGRVESMLEERDGDHPIPGHAHAWAASALAGGISGAWTWAVIYPFDVIKSRMQTDPLDRHLRRGMWTVASDIVRERGWRHMFRGLGVTLARAFPVNAIIFPVYEFVLVQLGDGG